VLFRHAEQLIKQAQNMEELAKSMAIDFEAEVTLALDVLMDIDAVICPLETFSKRFPHTRVRILETSMTGTTEALIEQKADIVIGATVPVGFSGEQLRTINMIPVAAPSHPLFKFEQINEFELKSHRQVVLRDSGLRTQRDAGWLQAEQRWTVSHFFSSINLIKSGLAFGFLPANWIKRDLEQGLLKEIPLSGGYTRAIPMYLMLAAREAPGPATKGLVALLIKELNK